MYGNLGSEWCKILILLYTMRVELAFAPVDYTHLKQSLDCRKRPGGMVETPNFNYWMLLMWMVLPTCLAGLL